MATQRINASWSRRPMEVSIQSTDVDAYIRNYWGKAQPVAFDQPAWHPLAYHCFDVAAAGDALLEVRPEYLDALASSACMERELARQWFVFALSQHDIGKFSDCFQVKYRHISPSLLPQVPAQDPGHGGVGRALWACNCDLDMPSDLGGFGHLFRHPTARTKYIFGFTAWMDAVFGHHGRPVATAPALKSLISAEAARDARQFVDASVDLFQPHVSPHAPIPDGKDFARSSWLVAGLAMIADWIGSCQNPGWFPYQPPEWSLDAYWPRAQQRARSAVHLAGIARPPVSTAFSLRDALADLPSDVDVMPTPLQSWVGTEFKPDGQTLVVIEDLTGAGKTEAALCAAHRLMACGAAEGLYWALPTMATANSLYARLSASYHHLFSDPSQVSLVLAHGKRGFHDKFRESVLPAGREEDPTADPALKPTNDDETSSAQCARWIADDRRKAFLADVGVGTLDQALLAVLPAKHQAIRLASLARRVLVCDEVHSYDSYTGKLLQTLLTFHAANGGSATLLTATLTQKLRAELIGAFAKGARWRPAPRIESNAFPLITVVTESESAQEIACASSRGTRRDLAVRRIESEAAAGEVLANSVERGEAAVWIRNTVHDAIGATQMLRSRLGDDRVLLFHARFTLGDRMDREHLVLNTFGKGTRGPGVRNKVLVATQVVEQALDLDFDQMVSDLAPIDLMIQRAGRLHRHERGTRVAPVLGVLGPQPVPDAAANWYKQMFPKGQFVYPDHGQLWLTMQYMAANGLKLASASPRAPIEWVFRDDAPELSKALSDISGRASGRFMAQRGHAGMNALNLGEGYSKASGAWESDAVTPTRLGSKQRILRLAKWDGTSLTPWYGDDDLATAWRLSEVQVLAARAARIEINDVLLRKVCDRVVASWGDPFDPPLLVPLTADGTIWRATAVDDRDQRVPLTYSTMLGLQLG